MKNFVCTYNCIFCTQPVIELSIEHIVPESLGNLDYILELGHICRKCNNSFSDFEEKALGKTMLAFERTRLGIVTKKGKAAQAKSQNIKFKGDEKFRKNIVTVYGFEEKDIKIIGADGTFEIKVMDFDKSEMATSKLILKIGMESLFQSQRAIFSANDFSELRNHLTKNNNNPWPILTCKTMLNGFQSIPRFIDKKRLNGIRCKILFKAVDDKTFLLMFKYTILTYVVNLKSRDIGWTKQFFEVDSLTNLYPEHLKKKIF